MKTQGEGMPPHVFTFCPPPKAWGGRRCRAIEGRRAAHVGQGGALHAAEPERHVRPAPPGVGRVRAGGVWRTGAGAGWVFLYETMPRPGSLSLYCAFFTGRGGGGGLRIERRSSWRRSLGGKPQRRPRGQPRGPPGQPPGRSRVGRRLVSPIGVFCR